MPLLTFPPNSQQPLEKLTFHFIVKIATLLPTVTELMKGFVEKKDDVVMMKVCSDFISMNWRDVTNLQIKKVFREAIRQLDLSTYRRDSIITLMKKQYLTDEQKNAQDLKKIPKIIKELQKTIDAMTEDAQDQLKKEIQETFKTKEQLEFIRDLDGMFDLPPAKKQRCISDNEVIENCLDVSTCSLFDLWLKFHFK